MTTPRKPIDLTNSTKGLGKTVGMGLAGTGASGAFSSTASTSPSGTASNTGAAGTGRPRVTVPIPRMPIKSGARASTATSATSATSAAASSSTSSKTKKEVVFTETPSKVSVKRPRKYTRKDRDLETDPRENIPFLYYPEKDDPNYQRDLYRKWEFQRSKVSSNFAQTKIEELCGIKKVLWPYQEFLRNFLSKETPYNGALLWHGVGTGKTCGAVTIAEGLRPYIESAKKNVFIIAPQHVEENFKNELYSFTNEKREQSEGLDPGSLQCTGLTYYLPPVGRDKEKARKSAIKARMSEGRSVYKFFGIGSKFPNYVRDLKENYNVDLAEWFSNSLFIIDEAHRIVTKEGIGQEHSDPFAEIMSGTLSEKTKTKKAKRAKKKASSNSGFSDSDSGSDSESDSSDGENEGIKGKKGMSKAKAKEEDDDDIPSPKLLPVLKEIFKVANNTKVVLLTATPIHDDPHEIIEIINLLRINDKEPELMEPEKLFIKDITDPNFTANEKIDKKYFDRMSKGYISYIRGENPVSFPEVRVPEDSYTPHCIRDITGTKFIVPIPLDINLGLVRCPMDSIQYAVHQNWVSPPGAAGASATSSRGMIHLGVVGRQITTVVYPNLAPNELPLVGKRTGFFKVFEKNDQGGPLSASLASTTAKSLAAARGQPFGRTGKGKRVITQFKWQGGKNEFKKGTIGNNMQFLWHENIYPFSTKFYSMLYNIADNNRGITFIYSTFVENGAISAAMFLEANGFVRYHHEDTFKRNSKGFYDDIAAPYPLISYESYKQNNMPRRYRCYRCCQLHTDAIHVPAGGSLENDDPQGQLPHRFEQGVYSLYLQKGSTNLRQEEGDIIRSTENKYGKRIKFLIGSKIIGEGVNLFNVRQVHLLDPWHNSTVSYQARGRAIRNCSHKELPPNMRYVMIYEYCASCPEYFEGQEEYSLKVVEKYLQGNTTNIQKSIIIDGQNMGVTPVELLTETIDEEIFRRAWSKDVIIKYLERLAKMNAFDCNLFKALNYFPNTDKPYTRQCDYLPCDFECSWEPNEEELEDPDFLNYDTYNLFFSKTQVDRAIQTLREIIKRYPGGLLIDDILQLVRNVDPNIDEQYVFQALDEILGDPPGRLPMQLIDRMGRNGKLVYQGSAYIFQPNDIKDDRAPIRYRLKPLQIKRRDSKFAVTEKPEEIERKLAVKEVDHQNIAVNKLESLIKEYLSDPSIASLKPYEIERVLDTIPVIELAILFRTLVSDKKYLDPKYNLFKGVVIEYLAKRFMLLLAPMIRVRKELDPTVNALGIISQYFQSSLRTDNKNLVGTKYYIAGDRIDGYETINVDPTTGRLIFLPANSADVTIRQYTDNMESLATDNNLSNVAYGFYDEKMNKFKLSYTGGEVITFNTKSSKVSQRNIAKGKVIKTYQRPVLIEILDKLKYELEIRGVMDLDHIESSALGADELAFTIEMALRMLDMAEADEAIELASASDKDKDKDQDLEPRTKFLLYPYQNSDKIVIGNIEYPSCRIYDYITDPKSSEVKGQHKSQLKTSSSRPTAPLNLDRCTPKIR
jgi:hypothetical protein